MGTKLCNGCPLAEWISINGIYYNLKCTRYAKIVDVTIIKDKEVEAPFWCPEPSSGTEVKTIEQVHPIYGTKVGKKEDTNHPIIKDWHNIPRQVEWNTIQSKDVYHVPPFMSNGRKDIVVVYKGNAYFTYREVGDTSYEIHYCYENDIMSKVMVKHKIKEIKIERRSVYGY